MPDVAILKNGNKISVNVPSGESLLAAAHAAGLDFHAPCGGQGRCGKCAVIATGALSPPEAEEVAILSRYANGMRMACRAKVLGSCTVELPAEDTAVVEASFRHWDGPLEPIYSGGYGAAFDIGTTTVAGQIFSHSDKTPLAALGRMNAQQPYGADVLTRTTYAGSEGVETLSGIIRAQTADMLRELCAKAGIPTGSIRQLVVTGNSIMLYIFCGLSPMPLALFPFEMCTKFDEQRHPDIPMFEGIPVYFPGAAGAYVGADITCSVLAGDIFEHGGNVLLIDAGTNGEIVLKTPEGMVCTSTAAGPTFEGAGISCGGPAATGAIDRVAYDGTSFICHVIGSGRGKSLCGTGLIDAVSAMLQAGLVDKSGAMVKEAGGKFALPGTDVFIGKHDIRQLQLAKGAVRAGVDALLHECGISPRHLDELVLCGGFGTYLNPVTAQHIGLIPPVPLEKIRTIGNAAVCGAAQILQSRQKQLRAREIVQGMRTVDLSTNQYFIKRFIEAMAF